MLFVYSLYDVLAEQFTAPFVSKNNATAIRMVESTFAQNQRMDYPSFELWVLGIFHDDDKDHPLTTLAAHDVASFGPDGKHTTKVVEEADNL